MGRLKDFLGYLDDRHTVLHKAELRLCSLQEKYESYFAEVTGVRENELEQLTAHTLADRGSLPQWFNSELDKVQLEVERDFDQRIAELEQARSEILQRAEEQRSTSLDAEKRIKTKNRALDHEEERLKERSENLLKRISDHNQRITALGKGFGFFANFFKMRRLAAEKKALDDEQADVAARIESLRTSWKNVAQDHADKEHVRRIEWVKDEAEAATLSTKVEALRQNRHRMVIRTTLERVLDAQERETAEAAEADPACSRCGVANPPGNHFCHICARRLGEDRPDFDGSLEEIAEINNHFRRFSDGMKASQEIIGLVRGLKTGVEAFTASVREVKSSEDKYPLPKLELEVPPWSVKYGKHFDNLEAAVARDFSLHPIVFAEHVQDLVGKVFTEEYIKVYFETMGDELSRQAAAQWE